MDPQRTARERARDRADRVETAAATDGHSYPVRTEDLASEYGSRRLDADLAVALDTAGGEFDSPTEVRAAVESDADGRPEPTFDERERS